MISFVSANVYASPLSRFVEAGDCGYVESAKNFIGGQARAINVALPEDSTPDQIQYFAEKSFNAPFSNENPAESYLHLKYFITKTCGESLPESATLNPAAQKGVDMFYQMTADVGHPVPFTPSPIFDALILGGMVVGLSVSFGYVLSKKKLNLFYKF